MKTIIKRTLCVAFAVSTIHSIPAQAAGVNNVYYSAAMCSPTRFNAGRTDLEFNTRAVTGDGGPSVGGWFNTDRSNVERLVCPVPYDKFNNKPHIVVRAVVEDNSDDGDGRVRVTLCGQPAQGATTCDNTTGEAVSGAGGTGTSTLTVSIRPNPGQANQDPLRWFWVEVEVPHFDGSRPSGSRTSGLLGYRVLRCDGPSNAPDCSAVN